MKQRETFLSKHSISSLNQQGKLEKHFTLNLAGNLDNSLLKKKVQECVPKPKGRRPPPLPPKTKFTWFALNLIRKHKEEERIKEDTVIEKKIKKGRISHVISQTRSPRYNH